LLVMLKGLPMTYNRDLQEDKQRLFDTVDTVRAAVRLGASLLQHTQANRESCQRAAGDPALLTTDLVDYLVRKKVPFREAHHAVGRLVAVAERQAKPLDQLKIEELQSVEPRFAPDAVKLFDVKKALDTRELTGAPSYAAVKRQLSRWKKALEAGAG